MCFLMKLLAVAGVEKTKRSGDSFTIGMEWNTEKLEWNAKIGQDSAQTGNTEKQANAQIKIKLA